MGTENKSVRRFECSRVQGQYRKKVRQFGGSGGKRRTVWLFKGSLALGSSRTLEPSNSRTIERVEVPILWNMTHD